MTPLITIGITSFREGEWLRECWESVLAQDDGRWEAVLVQDLGASDESRRIFDELDHPRLRKHRMAKRGYNSGTRNMAFEMTRTPYHFYLDGDDLLLPGAVRTVLDAFEKNPDADFVWGDFQNFGKAENPVRFPRSYSERDWITRQVLPGPGAYTKAIWERCGGFVSDPEDILPLLMNNDYDFHLSIIEAGGKGVHCGEVLLRYRVHGEGQISVGSHVSPGIYRSYAVMLKRHPKFLADPLDRARFLAGGYYRSWRYWYGFLDARKTALIGRNILRYTDASSLKAAGIHGMRLARSGSLPPGKWKAILERRAERSRSRSRPLSIGILGTGAILNDVVPVLRANKCLRIGGIAGRDPERTRSRAAALGIERSFDDPEALIAESGIEAIYLAFPNDLHAPWIERSLEAGRHILCEKPMVLDGGDARRLGDLARRRGLILMEGFMYRHHPAIETALGLIEGGRIGKILSIRSVFVSPLDPGGNYRWDPARGGGSLRDLGSYCVHLSRAVTEEEPDGFEGEAVLSTSGVDFRFKGSLRFPSGVTAEIECGFTGRQAAHSAITGEEGRILIEYPWLPELASRHALIIETASGREEIEYPAENSYDLEFLAFFDAVRGIRSPLLSPEDAARNAEAINRLLASAKRVPAS